MIGYIIKKIIGSKNDREVRRLRPLVARINEAETPLQSLPDEALRGKTVLVNLSGRGDKDVAQVRELLS